MFGNLFKVFTFLLSRNLDKFCRRIQYTIPVYAPDQPVKCDQFSIKIKMVLGYSVYKVKYLKVKTTLLCPLRYF